MGEDVSREKLERQVVEDLIFRDNRYKTRIDEISDAVIGAKKMAMTTIRRNKLQTLLLLN